MSEKESKSEMEAMFPPLFQMKISDFHDDYSVTVSTCSECGAMVRNEILHLLWHRDMAKEGK